jgi:hypothetical protein
VLLPPLLRVDPRFSESLLDAQATAKKRPNAARTGSSIDDLGGQGFPALVQRMVKVSEWLDQHPHDPKNTMFSSCDNIYLLMHAATSTDPAARRGM